LDQINLTPDQAETTALPASARVGYEFAQPELFALALTHKSYAHEISGGSVHPRDNNERFEFLGDAVLDLAMTDLLMRSFPDDNEGQLSKKRASLVNEEALATIAKELKLDELIKLGKGETKSGGLSKPRILASSLEAVFGAVFVDRGYPPALEMVERLFAKKIAELASSDVEFRHDFKTRLQEKIQEERRATPTYRIECEAGPDHDKVFEVTVRVGEEILARGTGRSKKAAEQDAARVAMESLK
jgi:ribonuclease III